MLDFFGKIVRKAGGGIWSLISPRRWANPTLVTIWDGVMGVVDFVISVVKYLFLFPFINNAGADVKVVSTVLWFLLLAWCTQPKFMDTFLNAVAGVLEKAADWLYGLMKFWSPFNISKALVTIILCLILPLYGLLFAFSLIFRPWPFELKTETKVLRLSRLALTMGGINYLSSLEFMQMSVGRIPWVDPATNPLRGFFVLWGIVAVAILVWMKFLQTPEYEREWEDAKRNRNAFTAFLYMLVKDFLPTAKHWVCVNKDCKHKNMAKKEPIPDELCEKCGTRNPSAPWRCPGPQGQSCGQVHRMAAEVCNVCGARNPHLGATPPTLPPRGGTTVQCPSCGTPGLAGDRGCGNCGAAMSAATAATPPNTGGTGGSPPPAPATPTSLGDLF